LVHFGIGDRWDPAIGLLTAFGLIAGFRQIAFNWQIFMRAVNRTRPIFVASLVGLVTFAVATVPLMIAVGLTGYAAGMALSVLVQLFVRGYFLRRLFPGFRTVKHYARAIAPSGPAAAGVILARLLIGGDRTLARALAELALYVAVTIVATWYFERGLLAEMLGYVRGEGGIRTKAQALRRTGPREPSRA
jgi:O-antigen/teichoic acid export membrane protein